jgi:hypothetical protein
MGRNNPTDVVYNLTISTNPANSGNVDMQSELMRYDGVTQVEKKTSFTYNLMLDGKIRNDSGAKAVAKKIGKSKLVKHASVRR